MSARARVAWVPDDDRAWRRHGTVHLDAVVPPEIEALRFAVPAHIARVLRQVTGGRRSRVWRADEMHDLLDRI